MSNGIRRLYKSRTNRMIDGVCGGVAEFFALDPTLVRIAWVVLTFFGGLGILLYIVGMIFIPSNTGAFAAAGNGNTVSSSSNHRFWGILLVVVGSLWLMSNLGVWHRWWGFSWEFLLPTLLILAGVGFLFGGRNYLSNQKTNNDPSSTEGGSVADEQSIPHVSKLYRSRIDRKMFGVCGGLGAHLGIDSTIVRVLFVISAVASFGLTVFAYILMAIVVPDEPLIFNTQGG